MRHRLITLGPLLSLFVALGAARAEAPQRVSTSPFRINPDLDAQLTVTSLLVSFGPSMLHRPTLQVSAEPLSVDLLPGIDRNVVGNDWDDARSMSDGLLYAQLLLPQAINAIDVLISGGDDRLSTIATEGVVLAEALAMTLMATSMVKTIVGRPRPYVFDSSTSPEERASRGAHESFPSGHTSMAFAAASSYSYLFQKKHPDSPAVIPIWVTTHLMASTVALFRVEGGRHFWTDVLSGAALGSAIGLLVPYFHTRDPDDTDPTGLDDVRIVPSINSRGFGLHAMWFF